MEEKSNAEKAKENFLNGYNCAQAVVSAFADEQWFKETGLTTETVVKLASSFGGGMGRLREVCGAVSGMFMIAGIKNGYLPDQADAIQAKKTHYELIQQMASEFVKQNGSIICRELLTGISRSGEKLSCSKNLPNADSSVPEERTSEYYKKRPCDELVFRAVQIAERFLATTNK